MKTVAIVTKSNIPALCAALLATLVVFDAHAATRINGVCGAANGGSFQTAPRSNLCSAGSPTSVKGKGPYTWSCSGLNSGKTAICSTMPRISLPQLNPVSVTPTNVPLTAKGSTSTTIAPVAPVTVEDIPRIMRYSLNWPIASEMMTYWFAGTGKNKFVSLTDVLRLNSSGEAKIALSKWEAGAVPGARDLFADATIDEKNPRPRQQLVKELRKTLGSMSTFVIISGGKFDHVRSELAGVGEDYMDLDSEKKLSSMHWISEFPLNDNLYPPPPLDEFAGAYNRSVLRLLARGSVVVDSENVAHVTVEGLAAYFRDSYDFIDKGWNKVVSQPLGCWSFNHPFVAKVMGTCFFNSDFNNYSKTNPQKPGKAFRIFSRPEEVRLNRPLTFCYKLTEDEKKARQVWKAQNPGLGSVKPG